MTEDCPSGWEFNSENGKWYCFSTNELIWTDAEDHCASLGPGVHLASIHSQGELDWILSTPTMDQALKQERLRHLPQNPEDIVTIILHHPQKLELVFIGGLEALMKVQKGLGHGVTELPLTSRPGMEPNQLEEQICGDKCDYPKLEVRQGTRRKCRGSASTPVNYRIGCEVRELRKNGEPASGKKAALVRKGTVERGQQRAFLEQQNHRETGPRRIRLQICGDKRYYPKLEVRQGTRRKCRGSASTPVNYRNGCEVRELRKNAKPASG
ncbi:unnamed protein product [Cyprideis torosa]|uniref:Uncharacterized protein n=1 Tax=Cyprideis torosa TaxID=163714 RepID=A0A7R8ZRA3_9CRUS|nr:unnamed protein product [Cyprideis torosa]CAG0893791.1 unnamed protein product [Cyprideis torosa]